jgi:hypothetical protein
MAWVIEETPEAMEIPETDPISEGSLELDWDG